MAHPSWKGPREQVQLKLPKDVKDVLADRAQLAGMSYSEYVMALLRNESLDADGRPIWFAEALAGGSPNELPLAM